MKTMYYCVIESDPWDEGEIQLIGWFVDKDFFYKNQCAQDRLSDNFHDLLEKVKGDLKKIGKFDVFESCSGAYVFEPLGRKPFTKDDLYKVLDKHFEFSGNFEKWIKSAF